MKILYLGDVFGKPGRDLLLEKLSDLKLRLQPDFIFVNGENLADGKGLTEKTTKPLFEAGVDAFSSGNHLWDRNESHVYINRETRIVKPMNYPPMSPGAIYTTIRKDEMAITLFCLTGQIYMPPCDSPFTVFDRYYEELHSLESCLILDFHAESTAEKRAMAWHVNSRISALVGTHTHVQTADEEILPGGTAYITDIGMTGSHDSVIGVKKNLILQKFRSGVPVRYESASKGLQINGVLISINDEDRKAVSITRIRELSGE